MNAANAYLTLDDEALLTQCDVDHHRASGPGELKTALTSVSAVLGFKAGVYALPQVGDATPSDDEPSET